MNKKYSNILTLKIFFRRILLCAMMMLLSVQSVKAEEDEEEEDTDRYKRGYYARRYIPPRLIVGTNALYWACLSPNLKLDMHFAGRWAFGVSGQYGWMSFKDKNNLYYLKGLSAEIRAYTCMMPDKFRGFYVGLSCDVGQYDMKFVERFVGRQGEFIGGSITAGYTLPLDKHWDVTFHGAFGIENTTVDMYSSQYLPCYQYMKSYNHNYIGFTRIGVNFEYHFNPFRKWRVRR